MPPACVCTTKPRVSRLCGVPKRRTTLISGSSLDPFVATNKVKGEVFMIRRCFDEESTRVYERQRDYQRIAPRRSRTALSLVAWVLLSGALSSLAAATLPAGFTETLVANGLSGPTAMDFAPDGRLFVCLQGGNLRVIRNGA